MPCAHRPYRYRPMTGPWLDAAGNTPDLCPGCSRPITDLAPDGCELVNAQRWCITCLLDAVNRLLS
jgi:hypothetical protein